MQGRSALAALLGSLALAGCGAGSETEATASNHISSPPAAAAAVPATVPAARTGATRSGTFTVAPIVQAPGSAPVSMPATARAGRKRKASFARFRAAQLRLLREHCAAAPSSDPRCAGRRVDERVALAGFEEAAR